MEAIFGLWIFAVGSSVGSFLNVVAWRGPRGMSINGHSFCPRCNVPIASIDNIPIVGWLRLRGRCLTCQLPISAKYPFFEAVGGFMFLFLYVIEFLSYGSNLPITIGMHRDYGLPLNLTDLPPRLIWIFAAHIILLSTMLAIFMTRNNGHRMPSKYLIFSVCIVWASLLIDQSASNVNLMSLNITPAETPYELGWYICRAAINSIVAAVVVSAAQKFAQQPEPTMADQDEVRSSDSFVSLCWNWYLIVFLLMLSIGVLPSMVVLTVSIAISAVYLLCDPKGLSKPWGHAQSWLLGVSYLFILGWKTFYNFALQMIS